MLEEDFELVDVDRLVEEIVRALLHRLHRGVNVAERSDKDDVDHRMRLPHLADHVQARHPGHPVIGEHDVIPLPREHLEALLTRVGPVSRVADLPQEARERIALRLLVVNHK